VSIEVRRQHRTSSTSWGVIPTLLWLATAGLADIESSGRGSGTHPLSVSTIRRLEHGQTVPRVGTVEILALGLGTTINRWIGS
jgi:transcriptional regulator with XRE-family HTH domain